MDKKGRRTCGSLSDIKAICSCKEKNFCPRTDIKEELFLSCWKCHRNIGPIDPTSNNWYEEKNAEKKQFDVIYTGSRKITDEVKQIYELKYPGVICEESWDDIHEYRISLNIPDSIKNYYTFVIKEGISSISFSFQMALTSGTHKEIIKEILDELKKEKKEMT